MSKTIKLTFDVNTKKLDEAYEGLDKVAEESERAARSMGKFETSLKDTSKEADTLDQSIRELTAAEKNLLDMQQKLLDNTKKFTQEQEKANKAAKGFEIGAISDVLGKIDRFKNFTQALRDAGGVFQYLKNQAATAGEGLSIIRNNLAFLAGPQGVAVAATAAIAAATYALVDFGEAVGDELKSAKQEFAGLGVSGEDLEILTTKANTLTQAFGGDLRENMKAINNILGTFGGSAEEASNIVANFYDKLGSEKAQEAIEWANEYDTQLQKLGFSAQEMGNLLVNSIQAGVYDDKALDAVKEFGIRMNALTDAQQAMVDQDAGLKKTFEDIKSGAINGQEGVSQVSARLRELQAEGKDITPIVSELFGGAGEDLGVAVTQLDKFIAGTSELSAETQRLKDQETLIQQERVKAGNSIMSVWKPIKAFFVSIGNTIELYFYKALNEVIELFTPLGELIQKIVGYFSGLIKESTVLSTAFNLIKEIFYGMWTQVKRAFELITTVVGAVFDILVSIRNTILGVVSAFGEWLMSFDLINQAVTYISANWGEFYKYIIGTIRALSEAFGALSDVIKWVGEAFLQLSKGNFSQALDAVSTGVELAIARTKKAFLSAFEEEKKGIKDVVVETKKAQTTAGVAGGAGGAAGKADKAKEEDPKRADEEAIRRLERQKQRELAVIDLAERRKEMSAELAAVRRSELEFKYNELAEKLAEQLYTDIPSKWRDRYDNEEEQYQIKLLQMRKAATFATLALEEAQNKKSYEFTRKVVAEREAAITNHFDELLKLQDYYNGRNEYSSEVAAIKIKDIELEKNAALQEEQQKAFERLYNDFTLSEEERLKLQEEYNKKSQDLEKKNAEDLNEIEVNRLNLRNRIFKQANDEALESANIFGEMLKSSGTSVGALFGGITTLFTSFLSKSKELKKELEDIKEAKKGASLAELANLETREKLLKLRLGLMLVSQAVSTVTSTLTALNEEQIAGLDRGIEERNREIEQLKEQAEATRKLAEEEQRRAEQAQMINNKLAEQRVKELEFLLQTLPESEKEAAQQQIDAEKGKIKTLNKEKKKFVSAEEARIKELQKANEEDEKKKLELQAKNFDIQKAGNIAQTIITGTLAAIQAFSALAAIPIVGPGLAIGAATAVGVFTAAQVAFIAAQENPYRFNEGTLSVPGYGDTDTVHALLTPGEAVIPKDVNKKYAPALAAIFNGSIPAEVLNQMIHGYKFSNNVQTQSIDFSEVVSAIKNKETVSINIDEEGISTYLRQGFNKTKYLDKRLRRTI